MSAKKQNFWRQLAGFPSWWLQWKMERMQFTWVEICSMPG